MGNKLRRVLMIGLALMFLISSGKLIQTHLEGRKSEESYDHAAQLVGLPELEQAAKARTTEPAVEIREPTEVPLAVKPAEELQKITEPAAEPEPEPVPESEPAAQTEWVDPYADALKNMDFTALREENADVTGWIMIPDTKVSYPLMQGTDNDYYLKHDWRKWKSSQGAIYIDYRCNEDLSDFHTIIYGHKMNSGAMFGQLYKYEDKSFWEAHPNIYIADDSGSHVYRIFAMYEASVTTGSTYRAAFETDEQKQDFLDACIQQSEIATGIVPTVKDRVLTLSTCTGNGHATRWVVQAVYDETVENVD